MILLSKKIEITLLSYFTFMPFLKMLFKAFSAVFFAHLIACFVASKPRGCGFESHRSNEHYSFHIYNGSRRNPQKRFRI